MGFALFVKPKWIFDGIMPKPTVATWKRRVIRDTAKEYQVKAEALLLLPQDSKRPVSATWRLLQPILCPVNQKHYRVDLKSS